MKLKFQVLCVFICSRDYVSLCPDMFFLALIRKMERESFDQLSINSFWVDTKIKYEIFLDIFFPPVIISLLQKEGVQGFSDALD